MRGLEVASDATNQLALEAALRRMEQGRKSHDRIRLAASQRQVRCQPLVDPRHSAHFRIFALVTAGKDEGDEAAEPPSRELASKKDYQLNQALNLLKGLQIMQNKP